MAQWLVSSIRSVVMGLVMFGEDGTTACLPALHLAPDRYELVLYLL